MKYFFRKLASIIAVGGITTVSAAQDQPYVAIPPPPPRSYLFPNYGRTPCPPQPCPPAQIQGPPGPSNPDAIPNPPQAIQTPPPTPPADDLLAGESEAKSILSTSTVVAAGKGLGSAVFDPHSTSVLTPVVLPGLFTASTAQSAVPVDRVFFDYGNFGGFQVVNAPQLHVTGPMPIYATNPSGGGTIFTGRYTNPVYSVQQSSGTSTGFNLNVFDMGVEKTFLGGLGSVYVCIPILYAADNTSGQQIDGLGDINAGIKFALYSTEAGSTITAGMTVSIPTGHAAVATSYVQSGTGTSATLVPSATSSTNPTFLQPWLAGIYFLDRFFIQEYGGILFSTDSQVPAMFNSNLTIGYTIYQNPRGLISSVTPTFSTGLLLPFGHQGTPASGTTATLSTATLPAPASPTAFSFPDQVTMMGGVEIGLGRGWMFSAGVVTPVAGPQGFNVGAVASVNFLF